MSRPSSFDLLLGQLNIELYGVGKGNGSNGSNGSQPVRYCECAELLDANGKRQPMPPGHSCEYVRQRNELIPEASRIAVNVEMPTRTVGQRRSWQRWTNWRNRRSIMGRLSFSKTVLNPAN